MTAKVIDFLYKEYPAKVSAVQIDGQWFPLASLYSWDQLKQSTDAFATEEAAIENAKAYIVYRADYETWRRDFQDKCDELLMGDTDWEWETPEQDWAGTEWPNREGRTGAEHAQKLFDEDPKTKAMYSPGGSRYEDKVKGDPSWQAKRRVVF